MRAGYRMVLRVAVLGAVAGGDVRADDARPTAQLTYAVDAGIEGCPGDDGLRGAIAARLGYDPFRPDGEVRVQARIRRAGRTLRARVAATDAAGASQGKRELDSATGDCAELGRALALAVSVAIDPFVLTRPEPAIAAEPVAPRPKLLSPPVTPPPRPPRDDATTTATPPGVLCWRAAGLAGIGAGSGAVPAVRPHLELGGAVRRGSIGARLQARFDLPAGADGPSGGSLTALRAGLRALGCGHHGRFAACAGATASALRATGDDLDAPMDATPIVAGVAIEAGARFPLGGSVGLELRGGLDLAIRRVTLELNHEPAFTTPILQPWAALTLAIELP